MAETQDQLGQQLDQVAADETAMETRVTDLVTDFRSKIAALQAQISGGQAIDLSALGDKLAAMDQRLVAFQSPPPPASAAPASTPASADATGDQTTAAPADAQGTADTRS